MNRGASPASVPESRIPNPESPLTVFVVAGEVSGDVAAAHLVEAMRRIRPDLRVLGVGGHRLRAAGAEIALDSETWGTVGYLEAYRRLPFFARRFVEVIRLARRAAPGLIVLVDFPGFNLRLAPRLAGVAPLAYYVPPMVYGRRVDRAGRLAGIPVRLLVTLPFDTPLYRAAGADAVYVGHPAVDLVEPATRDQAAARLGLDPARPILGVLPGSRAQELRSLLPAFLGAAALVRARLPAVQVVIPAAAPRHRAAIDAALAGSGVPARVVDGMATLAMRAADALLTASGTATLEAALRGTPMVIAYRLSWLTAQIARRVTHLRAVGLPNLLAGRAIAPEYLQDRVTPGSLAAEVLRLLDDPAARERMRADLLAATAGLGPPGAIDRAARAALDVAERRDRGPGIGDR